MTQSAKFVGKRTSCSVSTEPPPAATEEPEMDSPKEIFLKDYRKPDYLFDKVYIPFLIAFLHCFQYLIIYCWKFSNCHGLYVVRLVVWSPYLIEIAIVLDINIASKIQL